MEYTLSSRPGSVIQNFLIFSCLFSANHGSVVSCLSLATPRLGDLGSWQSSTLYFSYTFSALFGATFLVKSMGPKKATAFGMGLYCIYVGCFVFAIMYPRYKSVSALSGALIGGVGGGCLWTAQGSYFARASENYATAKGLKVEDATSFFGGIFAGVYLFVEVIIRVSSSIMLGWNWSWFSIFSGYTLVTVISAILMILVIDYPPSDEERRKNESYSTFYKATITCRLLVSDPKMKYMFPLSSTFALSSVFISSYVNAEVIRIALSDEKSIYVGILTSITSAVGGVASIVFGLLSGRIGNQTILCIGCSTFFVISFMFMIYPEIDHWNFISLAIIYALQGVGRATFEGTLKAEFALVFKEKEAAFGNIIFQSGLVTTIGYMMAANVFCHTKTRYCVMFNDGRYHNFLIFEIMTMTSAVMAVLGYRKVKDMNKIETQPDPLQTRLLSEDSHTQ